MAMASSAKLQVSSPTLVDEVPTPHSRGLINPHPVTVPLEIAESAGAREPPGWQSAVKKRHETSPSSAHMLPASWGSGGICNAVLVLQHACIPQ